MGFFNWLTGQKDGAFIEGRESKEHVHKDGTKGKDTYAAKVTYKGGEKVSEKNAGWDHVKSDSSKK